MKVSFPVSKNKEQKKIAYHSWRSDSRREYDTALKAIRRCVKQLLRTRLRGEKKPPLGSGGA